MPDHCRLQDAAPSAPRPRGIGVFWSPHRFPGRGRAPHERRLSWLAYHLGGNDRYHERTGVFEMLMWSSIDGPDFSSRLSHYSRASNADLKSLPSAPHSSCVRDLRTSLAIRARWAA